MSCRNCARLIIKSIFLPQFLLICRCRVHITLLTSMCRAMLFSARALKTFSLTLILWWETNRNVVYRGLYSYRQQVRVITIFSNIFSYFFCVLSEFAKVFKRKVWRVQVAHLHNAARALSSPSRCFQLPTNLHKGFFRYLWYCAILRHTSPQHFDHCNDAYRCR